MGVYYGFMQPSYLWHFQEPMTDLSDRPETAFHSQKQREKDICTPPFFFSAHLNFRVWCLKTNESSPLFFSLFFVTFNHLHPPFFFFVLVYFRYGVVWLVCIFWGLSVIHLQSPKPHGANHPGAIWPNLDGRTSPLWLRWETSVCSLKKIMSSQRTQDLSEQ